MTAPQDLSEDTSQHLFKNYLLLDLCVFLALVFIEIGLAFKLDGHNAKWVPEAPQHITRGILIFFLAGLAVSVVVGIWTIKGIGDAIIRRVGAEGSLVARQGFLFQDFGMALWLTIWVLASIGLSKFCDPIIGVHEGHEALGRVSCYFVGKSALLFAAGLTMGLLTGIYFWALRLEKETKSQILVTRYASKQWSPAGFLGIAAVVLIIITVVFYRLFTLE